MKFSLGFSEFNPVLILFKCLKAKRFAHCEFNKLWIMMCGNLADWNLGLGFGQGTHDASDELGLEMYINSISPIYCILVDDTDIRSLYGTPFFIYSKSENATSDRLT